MEPNLGSNSAFRRGTLVFLQKLKTCVKVQQKQPLLQNVIPVGWRIKYFIKNLPRITEIAITLSTVQGIFLDWTDCPVQEIIVYPPMLNSEQEKCLQKEITSLVQNETVIRVASN